MIPLPPVIIGCMRLNDWGMDTDGLARWIAAAVDMGATAFDHADCYGGYTAEGRFGEAMATQPGLRDRLTLISKVGVMFDAPGHPVAVKHYDLSSAHIIARTERSLRELRTDRLDWLLLHRPDPLMRMEELQEATEHLTRTGKVLRIGVSNFTPSLMRLSAKAMEGGIAANQIEISLEHPAAIFDGTLDTCRELGVLPMAWSPLGGGGLFNGDPARANLRQALLEVGQAHGGAAADQVALAWLMAHPAAIRPVIGTGRLDRVSGAMGAAAIRLTRQDWYRLLEAATGAPVP